MPITPYHERLGVPRPDMERVVERYHFGELKLIDLLGAALLNAIQDVYLTKEVTIA
jgi:hypothetical protein